VWILAVVGLLATMTVSMPVAAQQADQPERAEVARAPWFDDDLSTVQRIDAGDPIATAVEISRARFDDAEAQVVVVSRDDVFADSLAGTVWAHHGPILLTAPDRLDSRVESEIGRVLPAGGIVYLLGGTGALSPAVEAGLASDGWDVRRLSGASRVETSIEVAREWYANWGRYHDRVVLARADSWADSITVGVWAAGRMPIVLTPGTETHPAIVDYINEEWLRWFIVAGGNAAIRTDVVRSYIDSSPWPVSEVDETFLAGVTRTSTAAVFDTWYNGPYFNDTAGASHHVVINGFAEDGWTYGLPATALTTGDLRGRNVSLMLVDTDRIDIPVAARVSTCFDTNRHVLVVGPESRVSADVVDAMADRCVPDVIHPRPGDTWLCDRLGDLVDRVYTEPVDGGEWVNPHDWFDTFDGLSGACEAPGHHVLIGDFGPAFTTAVDDKHRDWDERDEAAGFPRVDLNHEGARVHGWAVPGDKGEWLAGDFQIDNPATGRSAFIHVSGRRSTASGEWSPLDQDALLDELVALTEMR
jgi:hypothetical protein